MWDIFKDENVGFYFRDGFWLMVKDEKEGMNDNDKKIFEEIKPITLDFNQKKNFFFKEKDNYYGFGWSHNFSKPGIWSEGPKSTILFKTKSNFEGLRVEILCKPYITKKNKILEFDVYVNNIFNKNIKLQNNQEDRKIEILMNKEFIKDKDVKIDFKFKNLVSPYEVLESPDSRKLGILAKNIEIFPI